MKRGVRTRILKSGLTEFQKKVLLEVCKIPRGKTLTYGEVARRVGKPGASRAVGNALNNNPFPIIVPCHRVVGRTSVGGYGGGTALKKQLLEKERK